MLEKERMTGRKERTIGVKMEVRRGRRSPKGRQKAREP
jgi:hypothetical protein